MKKISVNIGDLVMCKAKIDPLGNEEKENIKIVIGWITKKTTVDFYDSKEETYHVQWSDKLLDSKISGEDARIVKEFYLQKRIEMGI